MHRSGWHKSIRFQLTPLASIAYFFASSSSLLVYNKWLWVSFGFKYPVLTTAMHMLVSGIVGAAGVMLFDETAGACLSRPAALRGVAIGLAIAIDLCLTNMSFIFLTLPFIEMIKSATPLWTLLLSFATRIEQPSLLLVCAVLLMTVGLCLSAYGEANFNPAGFFMCLGASMLAGCSLVLTQMALKPVDPSKEMSGAALLAVSRFTAFPLCLAAGLVLEYRSLLASKFTHDAALGLQSGVAVGGGTLLAANFNVSELMLLKRTSALTLIVCQVCKVMAVSAVSVLFFHTSISTLNVLGYVVCMSGVSAFNASKCAHKSSSDSDFPLDDKVALLPLGSRVVAEGHSQSKDGNDEGEGEVESEEGASAQSEKEEGGGGEASNRPQFLGVTAEQDEDDPLLSCSSDDHVSRSSEDEADTAECPVWLETADCMATEGGGKGESGGAAAGEALGRVAQALLASSDANANSFGHATDRDMMLVEDHRDV